MPTPIVLGVCRRMLRHGQDAEDVFQAAFLVLARQANSIRCPGSLAGWLYRVTYRLAVKVNRRRERCRAVPLDDVPEPVFQPAPWREFLVVLDEELHALAERYRLPLILCYLEGKTRDQAAGQLGWSRRTLLRRLAEGRKQLRRRLQRHGISLPAALLTAGLVQPAQAALPGELFRQTIRSAVLFAAGNELAAQTVPAHVLGLAQGGLHSMTKIKIALVLLIILGAAGWGTTAFRFPAQAADPPPPAEASVPARKASSGSPLPESIWADLASGQRSSVTRALMKLGAAPPSQAVAFLKQRLRPVKDDPERAPQLIGDLDCKELARRQGAAEELEYMGKFAVPYLKSALAAKPSLEMRKRIEQILSRTQPNGVYFNLQPSIQNGTIMPNNFPHPAIPNGGSLKGIGKGGMNNFGGMGGMGMGGMGMGMGGMGMGMGGMGGMMGMGGMGMGGLHVYNNQLYPPPEPPAVWVRAVWAITVLEQIGTPEAHKILERLAGGSADALPTKEAQAALKRLGKQ